MPGQGGCRETLVGVIGASEAWITRNSVLETLALVFPNDRFVIRLRPLAAPTFSDRFVPDPDVRVARPSLVVGVTKYCFLVFCRWPLAVTKRLSPDEENLFTPLWALFSFCTAQRAALELNLPATLNRGGNEVFCPEPDSAFLELFTWRASMQDAP